jgi:hypothetical protein
METKDYVAKKAQLEDLIRQKDEYLAEFRKKALPLRAELEKHTAEKKVEAKVDAMSPAERQAMKEALEG